jgi:hypothetical protein
MSVATSIDASRSRRRPDDVSSIDTMTTLPSAQETDEATAARYAACSAGLNAALVMGSDTVKLTTDVQSEALYPG